MSKEIQTPFGTAILRQVTVGEEDFINGGLEIDELITKAGDKFYEARIDGIGLGVTAWTENQAVAKAIAEVALNWVNANHGDINYRD